MVAPFRPQPADPGWVHESRDKWRSADGRFDLIDTRQGYWLAEDANTGRQFRSVLVELCEQWCKCQKEDHP